MGAAAGAAGAAGRGLHVGWLMSSWAARAIGGDDPPHLGAGGVGVSRVGWATRGLRASTDGLAQAAGEWRRGCRTWLCVDGGLDGGLDGAGLSVGRSCVATFRASAASCGEQLIAKAQLERHVVDVGRAIMVRSHRPETAEEAASSRRLDDLAAG